MRDLRGHVLFPSLPDRGRPRLGRHRVWVGEVPGSVASPGALRELGEMPAEFIDARVPASPTTVHGGFFGSDLLAGVSDEFRVALLIPMCGSAGIWGPSCIASAEVAAYELNRRDGIAGRNVRLVLVDSAEEASTPVEDLVGGLIESRSIDAIVGMHISAVRQRLTKVVGGRIPYVYTPMYEGGEQSFGVFAIGDTPGQQLVPAMEWTRRKYRPRKWALIGNDYVWPRASNRYAKGKLADMKASLVYERYIPFSAPDLALEVEAIERSGAEVVLISLIGQDAVDFNRVFGHMGLDRRIIRLSCVIEENALLASGAQNLNRLFCASSYFGVLATDANACFRETYHSFHGDRAPVLGALGQSTYEGMHFLSSLMGDGRKDWREHCVSPAGPVVYRSARKASYVSNSNSATATYMARADGPVYRVIEKIF